VPTAAVNRGHHFILYTLYTVPTAAANRGRLSSALCMGHNVFMLYTLYRGQLSSALSMPFREMAGGGFILYTLYFILPFREMAGGGVV